MFWCEKQSTPSPQASVTWSLIGWFDWAGIVSDIFVCSFVFSTYDLVTFVPCPFMGSSDPDHACRVLQQGVSQNKVPNEFWTLYY